MQQAQPGNVGALIEWCAGQLDSAGVFFGHGTDNAIDEAAQLVYRAVGLEHGASVHADRAAQYALPVEPAQFRRVREWLERRIETRVPAAYLLKEAWFCGLSFFVDERVLVPRSPFAELIDARFTPWLVPGGVKRILEIGTGSGCIAIACAAAFPGSTIVASDISIAALEVAAINVARHGCGDRVSLVRSDLFEDLTGKFDLIISNPPYIPEKEIKNLPAEYHHEPGSALASGPDGLASARRILQDAPGFLEAGGLLAIEVGAGWRSMESDFPRLPFIWPELERGGEGIALIGAADIAGYQSR